MLTIVIGIREETIWATSKFFDQAYEEEWITDELSIKMIKDIDQSDVISGRLIDSPFLGPIPPTKISGGVKTLILIKYMPEYVFNGNQLGDNCLKWLLEICKTEDREVWFGYIPTFIDYEVNKPTDNCLKVRLVDDKGNDMIAHNQRDITNFCAFNLTMEPVDTSEIENLCIRLEQEAEEEYERKVKLDWLNIIMDKDVNTLDYRWHAEEFVRIYGEEFNYLVDRCTVDWGDED